MTVLTQRDASLFIQFRLGDKSYYLGDCVDLDSIPNPRLGGIDYIYCWNAKRNGFNKKGKKYSPPDNIEITLSELLEETRSWLEQVKCPFTTYALKRTCSDAGVFKNWIRGAIVYEGEITGDELTSYGHHVDDGESGHDYTIVAPPPRVDVWKLVASRQTTTAAQDLNSVAGCFNLFCDDECGEYTIPGDTVLAAGNSAVGPATGDVLETVDGGANWAALAVDPFGAGLDARSIACFEIAKGTNRILVVRETLAATPLQAAYSDDNGATWTTVNVGALVAEAATGPKSLFALDSQHIWIVTDSPNIYFSDDGGSTWVDQDATAAGANDLNAIHGINKDVLVAVGDADTIIYTLDGGLHWLAATATGHGDDVLSVVVFNEHRWLIGTAIGGAGVAEVYITYDGGATWAHRSYTGAGLENVADMSFCAPGVGLMVTNTVANLGSIHQTIDGGYTWEEIVAPANTGLNSVVMIDPTTAYVVGAVNGGTAVIIKLGV